MNSSDQKQVAAAAIQFFDRLDMKGSELQAANAVRGMLEGLHTGELSLVKTQQPMGVPGFEEAG